MTKLEKIELSKDSYELQALMLQHDKIEASYREIFPKVCSDLIHDVLLRLKKNPKNPPMYTVEVFTKEGTDSGACRDHILATTGTVPGIYDQGTHYVTHMRLTLEILKKLNDFEYVKEIMGDYTDTEASLGPIHNIGEAHLVIRTREQEPQRIPAVKRSIPSRGTKTKRSVIYTIIGVVGAIALAGFILSGGLAPNVNKSTPLESLDLGIISGHVTGPLGLPAVGASVLAHKVQGLPGTDQAFPDYTTNSIVSVDGNYVFNLPPGVYRITVSFPDGTNHVVGAYAVWPGSAHALDFEY